MSDQSERPKRRLGTTDAMQVGFAIIFAGFFLIGRGIYWMKGTYSRKVFVMPPEEPPEEEPPDPLP